MAAECVYFGNIQVGMPSKPVLPSPHTGGLKLSPCRGVCVRTSHGSHRQAQRMRCVTGSVFAEER